jgi:hypothetical protein
MKLTTVIKSLAAVLLSIAFCQAVLEGAIRFYSTVFFPRMMRLDETLVWKHATRLHTICE